MLSHIDYNVLCKAAVETPPHRDEPVNPCIPDPCGRYSKCNSANDSPSCACLPGYQGIPPYCRPQCETNSDCGNNLACMNEKCQDPCINACGQNAKCSVSLHVARCSCVDGLVGDPFVSCHIPVLYLPSKFIDNKNNKNKKVCEFAMAFPTTSKRISKYYH